MSDPHQPLPLLGGLSAAEFVSRYWQKEPLLVRQAIPGYRCPVDPGELAGLACEQEVESRLIMEHGGERPWQVEHGPFPEERFLTLPDTHWTVLVQEINKHVEEFAELQDRFDFIPGWRLDDVMVSFAPLGGTVGPHADNYDVFLIQGLGTRRWQINHQEPGEDELLPDLPLRIMAHFEAEQEWVMEPGDMLYLPPGVAHYGVALEDCLTVSVGFRAPHRGGLLTAFLEDQAVAVNDEQFYTDPDLETQVECGELSMVARRKIRELLRSVDLSDAHLDAWFAAFVTETKPGHEIPLPERSLDAAALAALLESGHTLQRSEYCRYLHYFEGGEMRFFVAGTRRELSPELAFAAPLLSGRRRYDTAQLLHHRDTPGFLALLADLHNDGCLYFPDWS